MRALVTGFTASQCGRKTPRGVYTFATALPDLLRRGGVKTEQRAYVPGVGDWTAFDAVYVGLSGPANLTSGDRYTALAAIAETPPERLRLYLDDWKWERVEIEARYLARSHPEKLTLERDRKRRHWEWAWANVDVLIRACERLLEPWPLTLVPRFSWGGDVDIETLVNPLYVDPSELLHRVYSNPHRERRWVSAALLDDERWLDRLPATWPVERVGHRAKTRVLPEREVLGLYASSWGVVSQPHRAAVVTGGWWRNRFCYSRAVSLGSHATSLGNVLLYPDFAQPVESIESRSDASLRELAAWQADVFWGSVEPIESAIERVRLSVQ